MSFQAYLDNVQKQTGKSAGDLKALAVAKGFADDDGLKVNAGQIIDWLKAEFGLGHGHAMSIVAYLKGKRD